MRAPNCRRNYGSNLILHQAPVLERIECNNNMNTRATLRMAFQLGRLLLLLMSLLALSIAFSWRSNRSIVRRIDAYIIRSYTNKRELQLKEANLFIAAGQNQEAIKVLENFIEELRDIRKHDRLDPIKRIAMAKLVQLYITMNDFNQALRLLETWIAFDERDLFAQVELAELLGRIPGRATDGVRIITDHYEKVPTFLPVVDAYINLLLDNDQNTEALLVSYRYAKATEILIPKRNWELFWDNGSSFNAKESERITPIRDKDGYITISYLLPKGQIKRVRIDCPAGMRLRIKHSMMNFNDGSNEVSFLLKDVVLGHHDIILTVEDDLVTNGKDPYFYFDVPEGIGNNEQVKVVFRAKVLIRPPERLNTLLLDSKVRKQIVSSLSDRDENEAVDYVANSVFIKFPNVLPDVDDYLDFLLDNGENMEAALVGYRRSKMLEDKLRSMDWQVYWNTGTSFNEKQTKRLKSPWQDDGEFLVLTLTVPPGKLGRFRIDCPGGIKLRIRNSAISFDDGSNQSSLLIKNIVARYNDITPLKDGSLITHGRDPYFYFDVPEGIGIKGEVKIVFRAKVSIRVPERFNTLFRESKVRKQVVNDLIETGKNGAAHYITNLQLH